MFIKEGVDIFRKSVYPNIQLDIFRNSEVLLQLFKQSDVGNWELEMSFLDRSKKDGFISHVIFNEYKANNKVNLLRFKESVYSRLFHQVYLENAGKDVYFQYLENMVNLKVYIIEFLYSVYDIKKEEEIILEVGSYS